MYAPLAYFYARGYTIVASIPIVRNLKLLGVVFDSSGNWNSHVDYTVKKVSRNLCLVRMLKMSLSPNDLNLVYFSIVRSILLLAIIYWA